MKMSRIQSVMSFGSNGTIEHTLTHVSIEKYLVLSLMTLSTLISL